MGDRGYIPYREIVKELDIKKGDMVYIISDLLALVKKARDYDEIINIEEFIVSLQEAVGDEGTLLFPTFNWDFCKGIQFDYYKTRGMTGVLGNKSLAMKNFKRTKHPIYSFSVWGKERECLVGLDNHSAFGAESPFEYMKSHGAKALVIGLSASVGNSFIHYAEQEENVTYRYHKAFSAKYIDEMGVESERTYSMYVRNLDMNLKATDFTGIDLVISKLGISIDYLLNEVPFHLVDLKGLFEVISLEIRYNQAKNLYVMQGENDEKIK